jgi:hypothetical protein
MMLRRWPTFLLRPGEETIALRRILRLRGASAPTLTNVLLRLAKQPLRERQFGEPEATLDLIREVFEDGESDEQGRENTQ